MRMRSILAVVFAVVAVASVAKAEVDIDFDGKNLRNGALPVSANRGIIASGSQSGLLECENIPSPGVPVVSGFDPKAGRHKRNGGKIVGAIKDILSDSSAAAQNSMLELYVNKSGKVVLRRDGVVLRVIDDPEAVVELSGMLARTRDEVVDAWEEETVESVSADSLLKKVCRFLFERVCRWISCPYPGQPQDEYQNCVQECVIRITPLGCQVN